MMHTNNFPSPKHDESKQIIIDNAFEEKYLDLLDNDNFPCLVRRGEKIENPNDTDNIEEKYAITARNGLRNLIYGTSFTEGHFITWANFKSFIIARDKYLFDALRQEMFHVFLQAKQLLERETLTPDAERRLDTFINHLLAAYPFIDPEEGERVILPQKISDRWQAISYQFEKIDISPQTGLLSYFVEEETRLYAYGLAPNNTSAQPYLLLMGSTYPAGQGAALNWLYNLAPRQSVGEKHDMKNISPWLEKQNNAVKLVGHSKGGTMAMIIAAKHPRKVSNAYCLNPTALSHATLNRLNPKWHSTPNNQKPHIHVYTQDRDPVFLLEDSLLKGTRVYDIKIPDYTPGYLEAHAHYFAGRRSAVITEIKDIHAKLNQNPRRREFSTDMLNLAKWSVFSQLSIRFIFWGGVRKIERFYDKHTPLFQGLMFTAALSTFSILAVMGVLTPSAPLPLLTILAGVTVSALTPFFVPKIVKLATYTIYAVTFAAGAAVAVLTLTLGSLFSAIKIGVKSVLGYYTSSPDNPEHPPINKPVSSNHSTVFLSRSLSANKMNNELNSINTVSRNNEHSSVKQLFTTSIMNPQQDNSIYFDQSISPTPGLRP